MSEIIHAFKIEDIYIGQIASFQKTIEENDIDIFSNLSGDDNLLHMNDNFALKRGFKSRVVHGLLLSSYLSRLIGVYLPGENALIHSMSLKFLSPCYINDTVQVSAVADQISLSTNVIMLKVSIENTNTKVLLAKGKVQVGFTTEQNLT